MKFSKMEQEARKIVLDSGSEISIDEIWTLLGKDKSPHWRSKACELMRRVCLKSHIIPPAIERKTPLGTGAKAKYGTALRHQRRLRATEVRG